MEKIHLFIHSYFLHSHSSNLFHPLKMSKKTYEQFSEEKVEQKKKSKLNNPLHEYNNLESTALTNSTNSPDFKLSCHENNTNKATIIDLSRLLQPYSVLLTHLCRDCQQQLFSDKEKVVCNGERVELKISMCLECAKKNINARDDNDPWKKVAKNHLWKLTKSHFVVITYLCSDCLNHISADEESIKCCTDNVSIRIDMCNKCAKKNCHITNGLAPWKPEK